MTLIANDTGEYLSFGSTVPFITTRTSPETLRSNCAFLVSRVVQAHQEYVDEATRSDTLDSATPCITLPIPIVRENGSTLADASRMAALALSVIADELTAQGCCLISTTPVGFSGVKSDGSGYEIGFVIMAMTPTIVEKISEDYATTGMEKPEAYLTIWTAQASTMYGEQAIRKASSSVQEAISKALRGDGPVH